MKTEFELTGFHLSLAGLWNAHGGLQWAPEHAKTLQEAWKSAKEKFEKNVTGFFHYDAKKNELDAIQQLATELKRDFEGALLIGIGGSFLGGLALQHALHDSDAAENFPLHWLSNVDGDSIRRAERFVKKRKVATVVISKSGCTLETMSAFLHLSSMVDPKSIVTITDPEKGELRKLTRAHGWKSFDVPPSIGGRFSVMTPVGLLPLALAGIDIHSLMEGTRQSRAELLRVEGQDNPACLFALSKFLWDQKKHGIQYLMPYHAGLKFVGDWYVQLWAESLGKKSKLDPYVNVGPTPVAALGTSDQHSILQLLKEGPPNKVVGFLDVKVPARVRTVGVPAFDCDAFSFIYHHSFETLNHLACKATCRSLSNSSVPTYRIELGGIDAKSLGSLLFFFMTSCAVAGELYQVNAFDQPGVEESKRLWTQSLS